MNYVYFELVLESLTKSPLAAATIVFGIILGDFFSSPEPKAPGRCGGGGGLIV